jgi:hypothetical protein
MKKNLTFLLLALFAVGCYPDQPDHIEDLDLVYTNYSPSFNFSAQRTYAIPDSVVKLDGDLIPGQSPNMVGQPYNQWIIQRIMDGMSSAGWTRVPAYANPDVILLPAVNTTTTVNYYYDWSYWGWYYPGYAPGWGWYYPGYYMPSVQTYKSGTLIVAMTYPEGRGDNDYMPVVWAMVVDGLLEGSTQGLLDRIDRNIAQGFKQSPYLKLP